MIDELCVIFYTFLPALGVKIFIFGQTKITAISLMSKKVKLKKSLYIQTKNVKWIY